MNRLVHRFIVSLFVLTVCAAQIGPAWAENTEKEEKSAPPESSEKAEKANKPEKTKKVKKAGKGEKAEELVFTDTFGENPADLVSKGKNPFFSLEPGFKQFLVSKDEPEKNNLTVTVLEETKRVDGVETRIIEEREIEDGELVEVSRNYYAISKRTNNVYYFGEDSKSYKDGKVVNQSGSWVAGEKGARFGLIMPGCPLVGSRYYQEVAPGEAMDRAENIAVDATMEVPAGAFKGCLKTRETTPLEPGVTEYKLYAPGAGLIQDSELVLKEYGFKVKGTDSPKNAK